MGQKMKGDSDSESWDQTLVRFRAHLDAIYTVHDGRPSGGLVPENALARINKFIKEDLRRSVSDIFYSVFVHHFTNSLIRRQPLRDTEAGRGKRSRSSEAYLVGLLQAIRPTGGESDTFDTATAALSKRKHSFLLPGCVVN